MVITYGHISTFADGKFKHLDQQAEAMLLLVNTIDGRRSYIGLTLYSNIGSGLLYIIPNGDGTYKAGGENVMKSASSSFRDTVDSIVGFINSDGGDVDYEYEMII